MKNFIKSVAKRRSIYNISNEIPLNDSELEELVKSAINHTPSAFNSQSSRVLVLLNEDHQDFWNIVLSTLKKLVPESQFHVTEEKIKSFSSGFGTILFFEDQDTIEALQKQFKAYENNFPVWSQQSSGMLQIVIWTALHDSNIGASLQHYNPIIDDEVSLRWNIPKSWKLIAQMPFGKPTEEAPEKEFIDIDTRFKMIGSKSK